MQVRLLTCILQVDILSLFAMSKHDKDMCGCPVLYGVGMFGDKWSLLIIRDIMFFGKKYYGDFLNSGERIATNILADRLAGLEEKGILLKDKDPEHQSRYVYSLTDKGRDLLPVILAIVDWSEKYDDKTLIPESFINALRRNPKKLQRDILAASNKGKGFLP